MPLSIYLTARAGTISIASPYNPAWVAAVRDLPGRRFDGASKCWSIPRSSAAALAQLIRAWGPRLDVSGLELVEQAQEAQQASVEQSHAASVDPATLNIPAPAGLEYLPYQLAGIAYALGRSNTLIGDEMGLGKTIQAIGVLNADPSMRAIVVVCPASLKLNWKRELQKWAVRPLHVEVAEGKKPDTEALARLSAARQAGKTVALVLNYDLVKSWKSQLPRDIDLLVLDEAHYIKSPKAQRTQAILGGKDIPAIAARRRIALTGTPIPNRPIEAWGILHALAPAEFGSWRTYVTRYCEGKQGKYGWEVDGASNLDELQERLRGSLMVRRRKADVLKELPPKRRQIVELSADKKALKAEKAVQAKSAKVLKGLRAEVARTKTDGGASYTAAVERLRSARAVVFTELSQARHETALAKLPRVLEHLADCLEDSDRKVLVFAHHKDVVDGIRDGVIELLGSSKVCVTITGDTPMDARQQAVDRFQTDPSCRVFVGNIMAAGTGLTLTAASHVIFAELDWVPGNITQAEDRAHRIGQTDSVLVQHLVMDQSIDARMARLLVAKQAVIDAALDEPSGAAGDEADAVETGDADMVDAVIETAGEEAL